MHSLIIDREVLILTLLILLALQGCILYIVHPDTSLAIDLSDLKTFSSALEIYLNPWEISWSSGMQNPMPPSTRQTRLHRIGKPGSIELSKQEIFVKYIKKTWNLKTSIFTPG